VAAADVDLASKGDEIVVTLPGTSYVVTYYRAAAFLSNFSPNPLGLPFEQFADGVWKALESGRQYLLLLRRATVPQTDIGSSSAGAEIPLPAVLD
jgi:hypothetical protein